MKKNNENNDFNIGNYLDCVYRFWGRTTKRDVFVNEVIHVFLRQEMPKYEIDKASISKLLTHAYDLTKTVKRVVSNSNDSLTAGFVDLIKKATICPLSDLASAVHGALTLSGEAESESVRELYSKYEEDDYEAFLFRAFKYAAVMPNTPRKQKAKTGRKPRGSLDSVFYLSEEEKKYERTRLVNKITKSNDRLTKQDFHEMIELMAYASLAFSDEDKKVVAKRFLKRWVDDNDTNPSHAFLDYMDCARLTYGKERANRFIGWETPVNEAEASVVISPLPPAFKKAVRQNSFADVGRVLDTIADSRAAISSEELKTTLVDNHFFLPDFSGHITHSLWSYCLGMARLARKVNLVDEYCNALEEALKEYPKNETVNERANALIKTAKGLPI